MGQRRTPVSSTGFVHPRRWHALGLDKTGADERPSIECTAPTVWSYPDSRSSVQRQSSLVPSRIWTQTGSMPCPSGFKANIAIRTRKLARDNIFVRLAPIYPNSSEQCYILLAWPVCQSVLSIWWPHFLQLSRSRPKLLGLRRVRTMVGSPSGIWQMIESK